MDIVGIGIRDGSCLQKISTILLYRTIQTVCRKLVHNMSKFHKNSAKANCSSAAVTAYFKVLLVVCRGKFNNGVKNKKQ